MQRVNEGVKIVPRVRVATGCERKDVKYGKETGTQRYEKSEVRESREGNERIPMQGEGGEQKARGG